MARVTILVLCLSLVASGRTSIEKRSFQYEQGKENTHEFPTETSDVSEIKNIGNLQYSNHGSVLESNGHEGIGYDGASHELVEENEGHENSFSNRHLAHLYYIHNNPDYSSSVEEGKSIGHFDINKHSSSEEGKESSGGVSYQYFQTGGHSIINSDPNAYTTYENHEDHAEENGNNNYGYHGTEGIHHSFANFPSHQEPEIHEVTKVVPVHETIKIPEPHKVQKLLRIPVPVRVLEPFPIRFPVPYAVEKTVHVPVERIVKYRVEKPVPVKVEKEVPFAVAQPYPVPVPLYKLKLVIH